MRRDIADGVDLVVVARSELTIIDDPMQPDEVASELKKQGLRDWYSGVDKPALLVVDGVTS